MRSCSGSDSSANLGENLLRYCTMPREVCRSFRHAGFGILVMALIFALLGLHPLVVYILPKIQLLSVCIQFFHNSV